MPLALAKFLGIQIRVCHENHEHLNRAKFVDCTEVYLQMIKHDDFTVSINLTDILNELWDIAEGCISLRD